MQNRMVLIAGLAAWLLGCGSNSGEQSRPTQTANAHDHAPCGGMMRDTCPMQLPGTTAAATDVDGGAAITFTTAGDPTQLRERVTRMAAMHNEHAAGGHEGCAHHQAMMMPPAIASAEDAEGGARLVLRPNDPAQLDALREHARTMATRMANHECCAACEATSDPNVH